jgi:hypothetical protein
MAKRKALATAKDVRGFFKENPALIPAGAEKSLGETARGRIKPEAVKVFNKESGMEYREGNRPQVTLTVPLTDKRGRAYTRTVEVPDFAARLLAGDVAGKRGRLSAEALRLAGEAYAESL